MRTISYNEARQSLSTTMMKAIEDHAPILITRRNREAYALVSLEEYNSLEEMTYLLRSPVNARRLMGSIDSLKSGKGTEEDIIEWDQPSLRNHGMITCTDRKQISELLKGSANLLKAPTEHHSKVRGSQNP